MTPTEQQTVSSAYIVGPYRYSLSRRWGDGPPVLFVMLNPSTADALKDDPTIRRCISFTKAWEGASLEVVNLYAYRATSPEWLSRAVDPVGPLNDEVIADAVARAALVVAAWGSHPGPVRSRRQQVARMLPKDAVCLGRTREGHPRHPLYVPGAMAREPFPRVAVA